MTSITRVLPPPPRWAVAAAHAVVMCTLPAGLWRIAMASGLPVGFSPAVLRDSHDVPGWGSVWIVGLSLGQEALALLTLGLVRRWGDVLPRWLPGIGGRGVPAWAVVLPAGLGALLLTALGTSQLLLWPDVDHGPLTPTGHTVMGLCYLPLVLWGPLLGAVTVDHARRRWAGRETAGGER